MSSNPTVRKSRVYTPATDPNLICEGDRNGTESTSTLAPQV